MNDASVHTVWLLLAGGVGLLLQPGLLCLGVSDPTRRGWITPARRTLSAVCVGSLTFWLIGAGLLNPLGSSHAWWALTSETLVNAWTHWLASVAVVGVFATTMAHRVKPPVFLVSSALLGGLAYPLAAQATAHEALGGSSGWLTNLGFADFAGAGAIHLLAASATLAGLLAVRAECPLRRGNQPELPPKSATLGVPLACCLMTLGVIGLCGGAALEASAPVGWVLLNTSLAALAGGVTAAAVGRFAGVPAATRIVAGVIGGAVTASAVADQATPAVMIVVAASTTLAGLLANRLLVQYFDEIGAMVLGSFGVCGFVGLVVRTAWLPEAPELSLVACLSAQLLGAAAVAVFGFLSVFTLLILLRNLAPIVAAAEPAHAAERRLAAAWKRLTGPLGVADQAVDSGFAFPVIDPSPDGPGCGRADARRLLHAVLDGITAQACLIDEDGYLVETNQAWDAFARKLKGPGVGRVGASFRAICDSESVNTGAGASDLLNGLQAVATGDCLEYAGEYACVVTGEERIFEVKLRSFWAGDRNLVLLLQDDRSEERLAKQSVLSEKRKAETLADALEASQASLELAMKGGELGLWHWDVASGYFELSSNWLDRLGMMGAGLNADIESFRQLVHADELVLWTAEDAASLAPDEPYDRQFRLCGPNGEYQWVQVLGKSNGSNPDGSPESLSGVLIDIHDRKEAELRNAGMAKIIEDSLNEVYVVDAETDCFLEVNRGARENLGYSMDELRRMTPPDLKIDMTPRERDELLRPLLAGEIDRIEIESTNRRADGTTYPVMLSIQKGRLMDRDVVVAIGVDLTQRRQLEQQLAEAQRLESIGQLAAGVAHEMNTPLQYVGNNMKFLNDCSETMFKVIDAYAESMELGAPPTEWHQRVQRLARVVEETGFERIRAEVPRAIRDGLVGVERVLEIVLAMREFSHPGNQAMHPTDLNRAIKSTTTVTRSRWKDAAELDLQLDAGLPEVECEGCAINQVFVNLVVNAADAIVDRRERDPDSPAGRIVIRSWAEGGHAVFEVEDNGAGMPDAVRQRIFEPFYTTKEVGKGTGQGLSLSHTIVTQNHGGSLTARSTPGEGTTIRVELPFRQPSADASEGDVAREPLSV